jgi:hypothetical protein
LEELLFAERRTSLPDLASVDCASLRAPWHESSRRSQDPAGIERVPFTTVLVPMAAKEAVNNHRALEADAVQSWWALLASSAVSKSNS